jgi:hypothetical protein
MVIGTGIRVAVHNLDAIPMIVVMAMSIPLAKVIMTRRWKGLHSGIGAPALQRRPRHWLTKHVLFSVHAQLMFLLLHESLIRLPLPSIPKLLLALMEFATGRRCH